MRVNILLFITELVLNRTEATQAERPSNPLVWGQ